MNDIRILLVGIGGYGNVYVNALLNKKEREGYKIVGVVDPYAKSAPGYEELLAEGVPFYDTIEAFYREHTAHLAVISTPIALHEEQALCAISHGSHVLLEKPMAGTSEAARRIANAAQERGVKLAIGFQWCYDSAMLALKRDIEEGLLGAPKRLRALVIWPRDKAYYARGTRWAGKKFDAQGRPVFDSVASNATAHYILNMLWVAGKGYAGADITSLEVETYRANRIETFDTVTLRGRLDSGAELLFVASHATAPGTQQDPMFEYEFEHATVRFGGYGARGAQLTAELADGRTKDYGVSHNDTDVKIWTMLDAIQGLAEIPCPPEAAIRHMEVIEKIHALRPEAEAFAEIAENDERVWVPGLEKRLCACYEGRMLLSEE